MAFPVGWPPRPASGVRSIRFFAEGTSTANFSDNAWLFVDGAGANVLLPTPVIPAGNIAGTPDTVIANVGAIPAQSVGGGAGGSPMGAGACQDPASKPSIWAGTIKITNNGGDPIEISFDGINVHGVVDTEEIALFRNRFEAGISVRGLGGASNAFRVEAW